MVYCMLQRGPITVDVSLQQFVEMYTNFKKNKQQHVSHKIKFIMQMTTGRSVMKLLRECGMDELRNLFVRVRMV